MLRRRAADVALALGLVTMGAGGWQLAQETGTPPADVAVSTETSTVQTVKIRRHVRTVRVKVKARVLKYEDHIVTVLVPRLVLHTPNRVFVVRRHVEKLRRAKRSKAHPNPVEAVMFAAAAKAPVTVYSTVFATVTVPAEPASTVTVTSPAPPPVTVYTTVTVVVPDTTLPAGGLTDD